MNTVLVFHINANIIYVFCYLSSFSLIPSKVLSKAVKFFSGVDSVAKTESLQRVVMRSSAHGGSTTTSVLSAVPEYSPTRRGYKPPLAPISSAYNPLEIGSTNKEQQSTKERVKAVIKNHHTLKLKPLDATALSAAALASVVDTETENELEEL
jgi:hypothetical protein